MPHFKADISELSKLSRALGLTDKSRTSFYTETSLILGLQQEGKKSALAPHLATLMEKSPLVSTLLVLRSGAGDLQALLEHTSINTVPVTVVKGFL